MRTFKLYQYSQEGLEVYATGVHFNNNVYVVELNNRTFHFNNEDEILSAFIERPDIQLHYDDESARERITNYIVPICAAIIETCTNSNVDDDDAFLRINQLFSMLPSAIA